MKPASSNPVPPQPASSQPVHFQSATELAHELRAGRIGARELLEHFLARVDRLNPALNAVIQQDRHGARARADAADAARSRGDPLGPLHGVPMTIKESYDFAGTPTTFGVPQYRDNIAATDALASGNRAQIRSSRSSRRSSRPSYTWRRTTPVPGTSTTSTCWFA